MHAPEPWSQTATNIVASKYLHGPLGTREREGGVDAMISPVVSTIARWGREGGYFQSQKDPAAFEDDLACLRLRQFAASNSPIWFNVGCVPWSAYCRETKRAAGVAALGGVADGSIGTESVPPLLSGDT